MKKSGAQSIIEFGITFLIAVFMVFFILECAFYYHGYNAVQTFGDEVNANLALYDIDDVCSEAQNLEILSIIENKAQRYFKKNIELRYVQNADDFIKIESLDKIGDKHTLTVKISCASGSSGVITKSDYVYSSVFLFRVGSVLSSISSVETPKF